MENSMNFKESLHLALVCVSNCISFSSPRRAHKSIRTHCSYRNKYEEVNKHREKETKKIFKFTKTNKEKKCKVNNQHKL